MHSGCTGLVIFASISDRLRDRSALIIITEIIGLIGLIVLIEVRSVQLRYVFSFISLSGALSGGPLILCWLIDNSPLEVSCPYTNDFEANRLEGTSKLGLGDQWMGKYCPFDCKPTLHSHIRPANV
jgi:hypothetical protein